MHTLLTDSPEEAAAFIRRGQLAAFPTETVYGLGANTFDAGAIRRIYEAKGRPGDNPLIVHVARREQVAALATHVPDQAEGLMAHFFPGPLTLILPRRSVVPEEVAAGLSTIGVRMPAHAVAHAFLEACGCPVAAPSANRSGRPSPTTWQAVRDDLDGRIACILRGEPTTVGLESTVVDCTEPTPVVLRAGAISLEVLQTVIPAIRLAASAQEALARSPGTRYRHYAPAAQVVLVDAPPADRAAPDAGYIGLDAPPPGVSFGRIEVCEDVETYGRAVFAFFRACEAAGLRTIYCQRVAPEGLGLALMDRLQRAAQP